MNARLLEIIAATPGWIWKSSWQAGVIALAVLMVQKLLGHRLSAGWRYALWGVVTLRLLLPDLPQSKTSIYNFVPPAPSAAGIRVREALGFQGGDTALPAAQSDAQTETAAPVIARAVSTSTLIPRKHWLNCIWLAGAAWMLLRLFIATSRFRRAVRSSQKSVLPEVDEILDEAAAIYRMKKPLVIQTPAIESPAVIGLLRPLVVLPMDLEERFTRNEIRFLLLHELAHIRRGDLWTDFLAGVLRALHWFNPILQFAFLRMRHDREAACDAWVLRTQHEEGRLAYGETLIKVAQYLQSMPRPAGVLGIMGGRNQLRQRVLRIAGYVRPGKLAAVGGGLLIALLAMTMLTRAQTNGGDERNESQVPGESTGKKSQTYSERILAAARAGDGSAIQNIIQESFRGGPNIGEGGATTLLDSTLKDREIRTFKVLLNELRKTNLGKNWQPNDELLAGLAKEGRTDFLDILLVDGIDLKQFRALEKIAGAETSMWINRRAGEVEKERADIQKLVAACAKGESEAVKQLLESGVNVNGRTTDGNSWTPLTRAAAANQVEIVRLLLERGAEVDLPKHPGWDYTPLCLTRSVAVADLLKASGANVHANLFKRATSILTYVAEFNGAPMVQWFLDQGLDPKMIGDNDQTLLFGVKDVKTVEILLKAGVDPNRPNEFGATPLTQARNAGVVEALIKGGAKLTGMEDPLLLKMIQFSSADAVDAVIKAGAPHDAKILQKALIGAVHMDYGETVEVLINHGADPNESGEWSGPDHTLRPLEVSAIFGSAKAAKALIARGADPNASVRYGSMLKLSIQNNHKEVARVLKDAGAKGVSDLAYAVGIKDRARIDELLASPPAYADRPEFWDYVMSAATRRGDLAAVKTALNAGVPVVAEKDKTNGYASAASEGQWEVLELLLQMRKPGTDPAELQGALQGAVNNSHPYPTQRPTANFEKCVKILLAAGAPVQKDVVSTAVFTRNPGGNPRVIEMLVAGGADPNPDMEGLNPALKGKRLSDVISDTCKQPNCSIPDEAVLTTLERLGGITIDRKGGGTR